MKKILGLLAVVLLVSAAAYASCSTLEFISEGFPGFTVGVPANFDIEAYGGTPGYTYTIVAGAMPAGMSLSSAGHVSGTPTMADDTVVWVRLTDSVGCTRTMAFSVQVY